MLENNNSLGHTAPRSEILKKKKSRKKIFRKIRNTILVLTLSFILLLALAIGIIFYSPYTDLKELFVTTAMTTMEHKYLAHIFVSDEEIKGIMDKNRVKIPRVNTNTDEIKPSTSSSPDVQGAYADNGVELMPVSGKTYKGYLLIIKDPSRVAVGSTQKLGRQGMKVEDIVKNYGASAGINAGGFEDDNGHGSGGEPLGLLVENYKILHSYRSLSSKYTLIGFNRDNVLVLGNYTFRQIKKMDIRDAVSFRPFLVINGQPVIKYGNGGWGIAPRTAIGQRKNGTVLMLVIDGRQVGYSVGATLKDVQDIMLEYDAHNAANLDGGSSTTLYYEYKIINKPSSKHGPRYVPSAFIVKAQ